MNSKLLTFIGLISIGVVIGATLDALSEPESSDSEVTRPIMTTDSPNWNKRFSHYRIEFNPRYNSGRNWNKKLPC
ncbi:MAG: hypothetical protein AMJ55_00105 [Gammaproteobacteria bacterium SG8_15]|nr:MAG: hypothetical protein AMJ55_00105 [Gammaproteobacteria bacterium SG8_15]